MKMKPKYLSKMFVIGWMTIAMSLGIGWSIQPSSQYRVYGGAEVSKSSMVHTVDRFKTWILPPEEKLYRKYKKVYDNPKYFHQDTGVVRYPGQDGNPHTKGFFYGKYTRKMILPGTMIDRYGSNGTGRFFCPVGTSFGQRALPPFMEDAPYVKYEVKKPVEMNVGKTAPWFDQPGGGVQYYSSLTVNQLLELGIIRRAG